MRHQDDVPPSSVHVAMYVQDTDPLFDEGVTLVPYVWWFDTSIDRIKWRNAENTAWNFIGET